MAGQAQKKKKIHKILVLLRQEPLTEDLGTIAARVLGANRFITVFCENADREQGKRHSRLLKDGFEKDGRTFVFFGELNRICNASNVHVVNLNNHYFAT